jgi:hypothetical protein
MNPAAQDSRGYLPPASEDKWSLIGTSSTFLRAEHDQTIG